MKPQPLLKDAILSRVKARGGWVNSHGHFDRAYTVTSQNLNEAHELMEKKWTLVDSMIKQSSEEDYASRIETAVKMMIAQGVTHCATFIGVDPLSELRAIKAAQFVKKKYADKIHLVLINQVLKGVIDDEPNAWARKALDYVDIIGGLPSKDRPNHEKHLDILLSWAKETGKMIHVHIDQENNPDEHDTELLARKTIAYGLEGKVVAVHAISIGAHPPDERKEIYKLMKTAGLSVVCCPSAALSMKTLPKQSYIHNSMAPVVELLEAGIPVSLGIDNLSDIYLPLVDGDMYTELRMLAEANRYYDLDALVDISTKYGRISLGII